MDYAVYMPVGPRTPRYQEIAADLRRHIARHRMKPGDRVSGAAELAEEYGCAYMTARRAVQLLVAEGRVVSRQGLGTFVADASPPPPSLAEQVEDLRRRVEALERLA